MPALQILEEIVEVVKAGSAVKIVPHERISAKSCEQIVDAPVQHAVDELASQCQEETLEVIQRIQPSLAECEADPVPQFQFQEETDEVNQLIPANRTSNRRADRRRRAAQLQAAQQAWRDGAT